MANRPSPFQRGLPPRPAPPARRVGLLMERLALRGKILPEIQLRNLVVDESRGW